jgi:serine/threonine protein phosphatase PrpC
MLEAVGLSDLGLVRTNNEDRFFSSAAAGLCVLADGMGGAQAGEMASSLAVEAVAELTALEPPSQLLLETAFQEADRRVREAAASDPSLRGMGTTLVAALETPSGIAVSNIGDSRCWLWENDRLTLLTRDQNWVNEVGRSLGLSEEALSVHPLRHALTTAVGVGVLRRVQSRIVPVRTGSVILLSSDGLHEVATHDAIAAVLSEGGPLLFLCQGLIDIALANGGPDNVTVVLARF